MCALVSRAVGTLGTVAGVGGGRARARDADARLEMRWPMLIVRAMPMRDGTAHKRRPRTMYEGM